MKYKVLDNYLDKQDFKKIQSIVLEDNFPWYFNEYKTYGDKKEIINFQFVHTFYNNYQIQSPFFDLLKPLVKSINPTALIRIKCNLTPVYHKIVQHDFHTDMNENNIKDNVKVGIFYFNSNNGKTIFKNGEEVESIANRLLVFPVDQIHTGTTHTNTKTRVVLNINWI